MIHKPTLDVLKTALSQFEIYCGSVGDLCRWSQVDRNNLRTCLADGSITEGEVLAMIKARIFVLGQEMAALSVRAKEYADHVPSPEALAYALQHQQVPEGDIRSIRFDHGDTKDTFMVGRVDDLPERIFQKLLADPTPRVVCHEHDISCADGGPCTCD